MPMPDLLRNRGGNAPCLWFSRNNPFQTEEITCVLTKMEKAVQFTKLYKSSLSHKIHFPSFFNTVFHMKENQKTIYLIDAHALLFQTYHAIGPMSNAKGLPTNALFGFTRYLLTLRLERQPDYLVCVFDPDGPVFRETIYPDYKKNRDEIPSDLALQIGPVKELLSLMKIPVLAETSYEADDVLATIATEAEKKGMKVFLCTSDKDCRQLISDQISIYNLRKNLILDRQGLWDDWGVTPDQVIDLQVLVGDSVDNVPGVPGVGVKTAAKLLQEYQTLDNLLAHVDEIAGPKRRENLKASISFIPTSRQLVKLVRNVPLKMEWQKWQVQPWDAAGLLKKFQEWGFRRFADQIRQELEQRKTPIPKVEQSELFPEETQFPQNVFSEESLSGGLTGQKTEFYSEKNKKISEISNKPAYHLIDDQDKLRKFLQQLKQQSQFAIDLETTGLHKDASIVGYAFSWKAGEGWYLPVKGPTGSSILDAETTRKTLKPFLENPNLGKINQNIKYDSLILRQNQVELQGVVGDSMIADYLLNAGEKNHNLQQLARTHLNHEVIPITKLLGPKGPKQLRMDEVDPQQIVEYAGEDADLAWQLCEYLPKKLQSLGIEELYRKVEVPLIEVLAEMEYWGIRLDVARLQNLSQQMADNLKKIEDKIYVLAGETFNIASLKQLRRILFEKLKLPVKRKTGITGKPSTDQETLEWLATQNEKGELPRCLLEYRHLTKLKSTYIDALPQLVNPKTSRLHASFHQTVTTTGRLSSSDPNLQNIPIRTDLGGQIRQAFVPEPGWLLISADYSQIELRLLAHFSQDEELLRAFANNQDIHTLVASQIFGVSSSDVKSDMRRLAKTVNFGILYGMSAHGLAQRLQIRREEAEAFIQKYFEKYPRVLDYQTQLLQQCRERGFVSTLLGRRRSFQKDLIRTDSTFQQRNQPEREAINMEIQGSAADLIKVAMLNINRKMKKEPLRTRMLLQIHDELVFETPPEEVEVTTHLIHQEMTEALKEHLRVPLKVDLALGKNWLDVEAIKL